MVFGWWWPVGAAMLLPALGLVGWAVRRGGVARYAPLDWAFFGVVLLAYSIPAVVLPAPLDTDAQGFGYLALTAKLGGDLTTLAPLQPDVSYLYAPGFTVLVAFISSLSTLPLHTTQFWAGAVLSALVVMLLWDLGWVLASGEAGEAIPRPDQTAHSTPTRATTKRVLARATALAGVIGTGLFTAYMDSHYTTLLGLVFALLLFIEAARTLDGARFGPAWGALALAALVLAHPDTTIITALGYGPWLLLLWIAQPRPNFRRWLHLPLTIPLGALILLVPWLWRVVHLLGADIISPFSRDPAYWRIITSVPPEVIFHGGLIVLLAAFGVALGLLQRNRATLLALGWWLLVLDFGALGVLERAVPGLVAPVLRYDYPFSIAWHGPIVPYALAGGIALAWGWRKIAVWLGERGHVSYDDERGGRGSLHSPAPLRVTAWSLLIAAAAGMILAGAFHRDIIAASKGRVSFFGAFASHADVQAMTWLRENTPPDALILNFPGPQEGDWVPVIAEREAIYYRPQPFFQTEGDPLADTVQQAAFRAFWEDPADPTHADLLAEAGVDYVIVPQVVGNPASFAAHVRWQRPFTDAYPRAGEVADAPYLDLAFDADGAQVYRIEDS